MLNNRSKPLLIVDSTMSTASQSIAHSLECKVHVSNSLAVIMKRVNNLSILLFIIFIKLTLTCKIDAWNSGTTVNWVICPIFLVSRKCKTFSASRVSSKSRRCWQIYEFWIFIKYKNHYVYGSYLTSSRNRLSSDPNRLPCIAGYQHAWA